MTVTEYPAYVAGQTLTADELNLLADHAFERDRLLGRLIGFGVNCGFSGAFNGNILTIQPGLAVDQRGEPLVMRVAKPITFLPSPLAATYPFIEPAAQTWSVVARVDDTTLPQPPCTDVGCQGHSEKHLRQVVLDVVAGRVTGPRFAFAEHPIHKIQPLLLTPQGQPIGNIDAFKNDLNAVLTSLGAPLAGLTAKVSAVTVGTSELAGVRGYKVGWLNMVLAATVDYVRCKALNAIECFRDDTKPGVVLGAVTKSGNTWTFSCELKHHWEPPKGLSQALIGAGCQSMCAAAQDNLVSIVTNYAPPDPPPNPTPPPSGGGGGHGTILQPPLVFCLRGNPNCGLVLIPGPDLHRKWPLPGIKLPPEPDDYLPPIYENVNPIERVRGMLEGTYGHEKINVLDDGVFVGTTLIGQHDVNVKATIEDAITTHGGTPTVTILTQVEFDAALKGRELTGFQPGTSFSGSDHVVLITNSKGIVADMGVVPGIVAVRQAGPIAQVAVEAKASAGETLTRVDGFEKQFTAGMGTFTAGLTHLEASLATLNDDVTSIKGSPLDMRLALQRMDQMEARMLKSDALAERVSRLEGHARAQVGDLGIKTYTVDVGNTLAEFAQTAVKAMRTIDAPRNKNLVEYIDAVERKQSELEIAVRAGDPTIVASTTVELLDAMRTMVGGAGVEAGAKRALDAQFRAMKGLLE